jgi:hypothetical protein
MSGSRSVVYIMGAEIVSGSPGSRQIFELGWAVRVKYSSSWGNDVVGDKFSVSKQFLPGAMFAPPRYKFCSFGQQPVGTKLADVR